MIGQEGEVAAPVAEAGVRKATLGTLETLTLALPAGLLLDGAALDEAVLASFENLVPVTLGNIAGGSVLVALVYWLLYLRGKKA